MLKIQIFEFTSIRNQMQSQDWSLPFIIHSKIHKNTQILYFFLTNPFTWHFCFLFFHIFLMWFISSNEVFLKHMKQLCIWATLQIWKEVKFYLCNSISSTHYLSKNPNVEEINPTISVLYRITKYSGKNKRKNH